MPRGEPEEALSSREGFAGGGIRGRAMAERHEHHHGVVGVGIEFVRVLERPSAGFDAGVAGGPVAGEAHLAFLKPGGGLREGRVVFWNPRFAEGDGGDGGVPNGREAGLDAEAGFVVHEQAGEIVLGFFDNRVVRRVAEGVERHHGVEHRWENGGEAVAAFAHALDHPGLGGGERAAAERVEGETVVDFQERVAAQEKIPPRPEARVFFFREKSAFSIPAG